MNKLSLYEQLLYNWERGFYSVVKDGDRYGIFSTKDKEGKLRYCYANSIDVAKTLIGEYQSTQFGYPDEEEISMMRFRGTIHPSELMGKGFQLGDKVMITHGKYVGSEGEIMEVNQEGKSYAVKINGHDQCGWPWVFQNELKPVLPFEEKKDNCVVCKEQSPREGSNLFCESCKQQLLSGEPKEAVNSSVCKLCGHGTGIGFTTKEFETYIKVNGYIRMLEQGDKNARVEASIVNKSKRKKKIKN